MSKKNKPRCDLTDEQELAIRDFLDACVELNIAFDPQVIALILDRMGYKVLVPGKLVRKDREVKFIYGDPDPFRNVEDEYGPDGDALRERIAAPKSADEASTSKPPSRNPLGNILQ
jgi:hypothetical protein